MAESTPWQTIGPFFEVAMPAPGLSPLGPGLPGDRIRIDGTVRDGSGATVTDALIETWQADPAGRYRHPEDAGPGDDGFTGFGRIPTDQTGRFRLDTVKPGRVAGPAGEPQAPHLVVSVLARGILGRLVTRIYFEDEVANATDPVLALVPASRRPTLIARRTGHATYRFDIVLQGPDETVFFDV